MQLSFAQVQVDVALQKDSIVIGDQIDFLLSVKGKSTDKISWPKFHDTLAAGIDIISLSKIDTIKNSDKTITYKQKIKIISFDAGFYRIPPFVFANGIASKPLVLFVNTVNVDNQKPIKDIRPPLDAPISFMEIVPYLLIVVVFVTIGLLIYLFIKNRKQNKPLFNILKEEVIPPHVIALEALENLRQKKLWQQSKYKEYYTELTDVLREYLERRYAINAQEMVSEEIIAELKQAAISTDFIQSVSSTLLTADLVKFAKEKPMSDVNQQAFDNIYVFVKNTAVYINNQAEKGGEHDSV